MDCSLNNRVGRPLFSDYPSIEGADRLGDSINKPTSTERIMQSSWGAESDSLASPVRDENFNNNNVTSTESKSEAKTPSNYQTSSDYPTPSSSSSSKGRTGVSWSADEDRFLDENKHMRVKDLAIKLDRSTGSISSRKKQQSDPTHTAYQNIHGSSDGGNSNTVKGVTGAENRASFVTRSLLEEKARVLSGGRSLGGVAAKTNNTASSSSSKHSASSPATAPEPISLSTNQYEVIKLVLEGKSVFFSGSAGTGKSHVIKVLKQVFEQLGMTDSVAYTAPTGIAACNINGVTVHSWGGIGILDPKKELAKIISKIRGSKDTQRRWKGAKVLVIDEISMLSGDLFDGLSTIGQNVRSSDAPFGGIQLILCGDFFQLPPVGKNLPFAFESDTWRELFNGSEALGRQVVLDKVFRQKDPAFVNMLNELRRGEVSSGTNRILLNKVQQYQSNLRNETADDEQLLDKIKPTVLYPTNRDVDAHNLRNLTHLPGEAVTFTAKDTAKDDYLLKTLSNMKAPHDLNLKVGAQVMLLKNMDTASGLVNGARGVVVKFEPRNDGLPAEHPSFQNLYFPVISFRVPVSGAAGGQYEESQVLITEVEFSIEQQGIVVAKRIQLPLMLAWALSVHKSQGMTISNLQVSFSGMFEFGQAYVALSRATDLTGLRLVNFDVNTVKAHQRVKDFYRALGYSAEKDMSADDLMTTTVDELVAVYHTGQTLKRHRPIASDIKPEPLAAAAATSSSWSRGDAWIDARRPSFDPGMDDSFAPVRDAPSKKSTLHNFFNQFEYKKKAKTAAPVVVSAQPAPHVLDAFTGFPYDLDDDASNGACLPPAPAAPVYAAPVSAAPTVMSEELRAKIQANKEAAQRKMILRTQGL